MSIKLIERDGGPFVVPEKMTGADPFDENMYFKVLIDKKPYFYCHVQRIGMVGYIHAYGAGAFTVSMVKQIRKDFEHVKKALRYRGVEVIIGLMNEKEGCCDKWRKFVKILGFDAPDKFMAGKDLCNRVMMEV